MREPGARLDVLDIGLLVLFAEESWYRASESRSCCSPLWGGFGVRLGEDGQFAEDWPEANGDCGAKGWERYSLEVRVDGQPGCWRMSAEVCRRERYAGGDVVEASFGCSVTGGVGGSRDVWRALRNEGDGAFAPPSVLVRWGVGGRKKPGRGVLNSDARR